MNSPIKQWLQQAEAHETAPLRAKSVLKRKLFPRAFAWQFPLVAIPALGLLIMTLSVSPARHNGLNAQAVLAAVAAYDANPPEGSLEKITATTTLPDGTLAPTWTVFTDGVHYLQDVGEGEPPIWVEKNDDHLTLTEYSLGTSGIRRQIHGDQMYYDPARIDIDSWQTDPVATVLGLDGAFHDDGDVSISMCDDQGTCPESHLPRRFAGGDLTITADNDAGVLKVTSSGTPPNVQSLASNTPTDSIARTAIIRKSDMKLLETSFEAHMSDGRDLSGNTVFTYELVSEDSLSHPFTLEGWLDMVDPDKNMDILCMAYSSAFCADAEQKTESHEPQYIPAGWLQGAAFGGRKQVLD